jgi:hypothetical protein
MRVVVPPAMADRVPAKPSVSISSVEQSFSYLFRSYLHFGLYQIVLVHQDVYEQSDLTPLTLRIIAFTHGRQHHQARQRLSKTLLMR